MANIVFREIITGLQLLIKCLYIYINYLISPAAPLSRGGREARLYRMVQLVGMCGMGVILRNPD